MATVTGGGWKRTNGACATVGSVLGAAIGSGVGGDRGCGVGDGVAVDAGVAEAIGLGLALAVGVGVDREVAGELLRAGWLWALPQAARRKTRAARRTDAQMVRPAGQRRLS